MKCQEMISAGYENVNRGLESILSGLSEEDLNWQPGPESNSIGWLAWHLTRVQDGLVGRVMGEDQLWISEGWHEKFGRPADDNDVGVGHGPEDVAAFKSPGTDVLLGYHRAVLARSQGYFANLSDAELEKRIDDPRFQPPPRVGDFLMMVLSDGLQHAGQMAYIRGLRHGKGWFKI